MGESTKGFDTTIADPKTRIENFFHIWHDSKTETFDQPLISSHLTLLSTSATPVATCTFSLTIVPTFSNRMGNLHGGATALIFDVCTTACLAPLARPGFWTFAGITRNLNITYLRPAPVGEKCTVVCEVVHAGKRLATIRGEIRNARGEVCAIAEHLKATIDPPVGKRGPLFGAKL